MSYLALARKYRPRKFEDVMGQGHVVKALSHALSGDKLHPAILLTGTRGVGKTTLARIIAKGLNCEKGVSENPCNVCGACREVDEGRSVDMLEIDAASNTGVDNIRDIIERAQVAPSSSRYKVYLIDEVHMLSKGAFNALLKTLEEPPPYLKFILATTDPQKLLITVLSRCLQFNLKRLPAQIIRDQLNLVIKNEGLEADSGAVAELARAADGSMRDGLSLLDQAIAFSGGGKLQRGPVEEMLGTTGRQILFAILRALAARDAAGLQASIQQLEQQAPDYAALLNELAAHLQRIAVLQLLPDAQNEDDDAALVELKGLLGAEDVQLYYQIAVNGRRDMPYAPDPRLGFEMTLLRMLAFRLDEGPAARPAGAANTSAARPAPAAAPRAAAAAAPAPVAAAVPPTASAVIAVADDASWADRVEALGLDGFVRQLARNCVWKGRDGNHIGLSLDAKIKHLLNEDRRAAIERALAQQIGAPVKLAIELAVEAQPSEATPAQIEKQRAVDMQREIEAAVEADPTVRAFKDMFGATVKPGSIRPTHH